LGNPKAGDLSQIPLANKQKWTSGGCSSPARSASPHNKALHSRTGTHGLIHHSDRGCQYLSIRYTERLAEAGVNASVGSVGDSYDNALAETINGLYKTEVIRRRGPWRHIDAVEYATLEWVDWFNHRRLLEPIGDMPPAELEQAYYRQLEESAMAA
jgi:transposase InsO family protein